MSGRLGTQLNRNKERQVLECSKRIERGGEESRAEKRNLFLLLVVVVVVKFIMWKKGK